MFNRKKHLQKLATKHRYDLPTFIRKAITVHGDRYDYSLVDYKNSKTKITILCKSHGPFYQIPDSHINSGQGCPSCGNENKGKNKKINAHDFIEKCLKKHNSKYDYSLCVYRNMHSKIIVICPQHGEFEQKAQHHVNGSGCPHCAIKVRSDMRRSNILDFIEKSRDIHEDRYNYQESIYNGNKLPLTIQCPTHGNFKQKPNDHLDGHGCRYCALINSKIEANIEAFFKDQNFRVITNDRTILKPKELDIFVPELNIAIEYCGLYWHSEKFKSNSYHVKKWKQCKDQGIQLITIFEDEWIDRKDIVLSVLQNFIYNPILCYARECEIKNIDYEIAASFLNENHLQGKITASIHLGAFLNDKLVGVMCFSSPKRQSSYEWELVRFCTLINYRIPGLASKFNSYFIKTYDPSTIVSFSDNRWFSGKAYNELGFSLNGFVNPTYYYYSNKKGIKRFNKSRFRKSSISQPGDIRTEKEIMHEAGFLRIYDCGKMRWVWTR